MPKSYLEGANLRLNTQIPAKTNPRPDAQIPTKSAPDALIQARVSTCLSVTLLFIYVSLHGSYGPITTHCSPRSSQAVTTSKLTSRLIKAHPTQGEQDYN